MHMLDFKNIFTITRKELKSSFDNPTAYVTIAVFLLLWEFLFFRNAFLAGEASLRQLYDFLPWLLIIFIPAVTMGAMSQEKSEGTLELLLTHPVREYELLAGKFLGKLAFTAIALAFVFPIAFAFNQFGNLDWGQVAGQYLGAVFLSAVLISLGIFVSSLFASQISSMLVSAAAIFFLIIAGFEFVTASLPLQLAPILERLSALSHFDSMARGVIDLRDVWYAFSGIAVFLSLAYLRLIKQKFGNRKQIYRRFQTGITLFIGIAVLTNIVGSSIPGRLDLTENQAYTLSGATKKTLSDLSDVVNVTVFVSGKLPVQLQSIQRDLKDILRDYQNFGHGNITVAYKDPLADPQAAEEARSFGVTEIQFNTVGQTEFQSQAAYMGLAVSYASNHESIPVIQKTSDLEYQLTSFIKKLTVSDKKKIVFVGGHGEKSITGDYAALKKELDKQFSVEEKNLDDADSAIPEGTAVLVIAGPSEKITDKARESIKNFIDNGGSALFMIDAVTVELQTLSATANSEGFADFLNDYGITVNKDIIYDLKANQTVQMGGGGIFSLLVPYPFWAKLASQGAVGAIISNISEVTMPWASSVSFDEEKMKEKGFSADKILATTDAGGVQSGSFSLSPNSKPSQENLGIKYAAASFLRESKDNVKAARLIVAGDSDFLTDAFAQDNPQNIGFGSALFSWLGQEESLAGIKLKQEANRALRFDDADQAAMVKYGNLAAAVLLPAIYGMIRLSRRKKLRRFTYNSMN